MEHDDRLKKQIDQLGKVLGKILADLLQIKNQGDASISIDSVFVTFKTELDLDLEEIIDYPIDQLITKLKKEKGFTNSNLEILADILYHLDDGVNVTRKCECLERALTIYEYTQLQDANFSMERMEKINRIKTFLN
jgi:hypothetical protein